MLINVQYDASVDFAPAAFKTAVSDVVQYFQGQFSDPVTINVRIGYGEVNGSALNSGALGENVTNLISSTYSQVKNSLLSDAKTADDALASASLDTASPVNGTFWLTTAQAKSLGVLGASSAIDGYLGFASNVSFDYSRSDGISSGQYDFFGVVAHELSEVMGRSLLVGESLGGLPAGYEPLDLFHYSAAGVRDFSGAVPGYFSIDSGTTNLDNFNTDPRGDFGDWAASAGQDAFLAFSASGHVNAISETDLRLLDIIGWDRAGPPPVPGPPPVAVVGAGNTSANADFNADHQSDVLWRNSSSGEVVIWDIKNDQVTSNNSVGTADVSWQIAGAGDFNHDGTSDILWRNSSSGEVVTWEIKNNQAISNTSVGTASSAWQIAYTGDFNNDGTSDVLWRNNSTGEVVTWGINNDHVTSNSYVGTASASWQVAGAGDFNHDGASDILWQNSGTGEVVIWDLINSQIASNSYVAIVGSAWQIAGAGDFNNDGTSDILWRNSSTGEVVIWDMSNNHQISDDYVGTAGSAWQIVKIGDFNGDGTSDILWRNNSTGEVVTWDISHNQMISNDYLGLASTSWHIVA